MGWMGLIQLYVHHSQGGVIDCIVVVAHVDLMLGKCIVWRAIGSNVTVDNVGEVYVFQ